jgi:hypothetical protein
MASLQKLDTILYEVQQACIQLSLPPPSGVYDSSDDNVLMMGSVANLAGIMVAEAFDWQAMRKQFTANGDGITTAFDLPADLSRFVDGTGWSHAMRRPVVVVDTQQWANVQAWVPKLSINPMCRIFGDKLQFLTPPAAGDQITIEYVDANWVIDGADPLVKKQKVTANADKPRFDWLLMVQAIKVKWLEHKGMNTTAAQADFNERLYQLTQHDQMGQALTLSGPVPGGSLPLVSAANLPESGFGA